MGGLIAASRRALEAGLPALMLREKDLPEDEFLPLAREMRALTAAHDALLIINRRLDIARAVGADGLQTGVDGIALADARRALGENALLGYSAHDPNEAIRAFADGANYVIFSPIFETPSKSGILHPVGLDALARLVHIAPGPIIALGGIDESNLESVKQTGAKGIAVIRAIYGQADPARATKSIMRTWNPVHL